MNLEEALQNVSEANSGESRLDGLGRVHEIACQKTGFPLFTIQHELSPFKALSSIGKRLFFRDLETLRSNRSRKEKVKSLCRSIQLMQDCSDLRIRYRPRKPTKQPSNGSTRKTDTSSIRAKSGTATQKRSGLSKAKSRKLWRKSTPKPPVNSKAPSKSSPK